ncbi:hypothetical protein [Brumimicrobium aurantiacum]|uniref:DUF3575 domain-containing protein n=1 Tax=Brumimicrobium aurantiacum TaxID=1737063 RepID=A0A3E1EU58_9FLAO|nr:hypothetical protein [Brumimicrobium aurantiacum]RFC53091.1 hypothetical protein DXU93_14855 [Brumimicrobium aurantiacum]
MRFSILIIFFYFFITIGISQVKVKPVLNIHGASEVLCLNSYSRNEIDDTALRLLGLNLNPGIQLQTNSGTFGMLFNYQYSVFTNLYDFTRYRNHMIGGVIQYSLYSEIKRFRPYFSIEVKSEIATNSKNAYMDDYYVPHSLTYSSDFNHDGSYVFYKSRIYQSTPLVSSLIMGGDFRIIENLHLKFGFGYKLRLMKTKYAEWELGEDVNEKLKTTPNENHYFHMLDVQLGLSYSFTFKPK